MMAAVSNNVCLGCGHEWAGDLPCPKCGAKHEMKPLERMSMICVASMFGKPVVEQATAWCERIRSLKGHLYGIADVRALAVYAGGAQTLLDAAWAAGIEITVTPGNLITLFNMVEAEDTSLLWADSEFAWTHDDAARINTQARTNEGIAGIALSGVPVLVAANGPAARDRRARANTMGEWCQAARSLGYRVEVAV